MCILLFRWVIGSLEGFRHFYLHRFYPAWAHTLRLVTGWCPFSLGDILYTAAGVWLLLGALRFARELLHGRGRVAPLLRLLLILCCTYTIFLLSWGINYRYERLSAPFGIRRTGFSRAELLQLCDTLSKKVNALHFDLAHSDSLPVTQFLTFAQIRAQVPRAYAAKTLPQALRSYTAPSIKPSMFSYLMNYASVTGYFNPFTGEAQVNTTVPPLGLPFTTCHEVAHQLGFAAEDDANFVGYMVAASSPDPHFRYSANYEMFLYAMNALAMRDGAAADSLWLQLTTPGVRLDYEAERAFFERFRTPFRRWSNSFYDEYLKMNEQPKGIKSYSEVVALLMDYFRKNGRLP